MTECAGAVGTLADKRSKVSRRDETLMKKSKCQTFRRSADREISLYCVFLSHQSRKEVK